MRHFVLASALVLVSVLGGLAGCAKVRGVMAPNRPPETTLWVTGDLDTVSHTIRVYWDGQDPDGFVVGFLFKWAYEPGAAPPGYDPGRWTFTDRRDSLFTVYSPNGVDYPTLVVGAVDNEGAADTVDIGDRQRQQFKLANQAPTVRLTAMPPDTTLPVAVFSWVGSDPDGPISKAVYRVQLDGTPPRDTVVADTSITLPPRFFRNAAGEIEERRWTFSVETIDGGGRMSQPASYSWVVRAPVGTTLLVDDMPNTLVGASLPDGFYRAELAGRLGAGGYTVLDLEKGAFLRTGDAIRETFLLFQNVFWYSETNPTPSPVLALADGPIRDYLSARRNLFLTSQYLVGTGGALGQGFAREVLGATEIRENRADPRPDRWTTNFTIANGQFLVGAPGTAFDSLCSGGIYGATEAFVLQDPADAAYLAPPGTLDTLHTDDWPVAVSRKYGPGPKQGRLVFLSFPLRGMNRAFSGHPGRAADELRKVFDLFAM